MRKTSCLHHVFTPGRLGLALTLAVISGCGGGGGASDPLPGTVPSALIDQLAAQSAALKLECPKPYLFYSSFDNGGGNVQPPDVAPDITVGNVGFTAMASTASPVKLCVTTVTAAEVPAAVAAFTPGNVFDWTHVQLVGNVEGMKNKKVFFLNNYLAPMDEARKSAESESVYAALPDGQGGWTWQQLPTTRSYSVPSALPTSTQVKFEAAIPGPGYYIQYGFRP